jgi:putative heme-binding domain-containing protein
MPASAQDLENGQQLFQTLCSRCHGILGEGGEGPSLKRAQLTHAPDDETLVSVIVGGIPGTGMPGSRQLRGSDAQDVAAYVRGLGRLPAETMPGDPVAGQLVYQSVGNCSSCHILDGVGTGIGPELSQVGLRRNAAYLRQSVITPEADQPRVVDRFRGTLSAFLTVRIVSEYGTYEGMRINEDEFTVQMRDVAGDIYSFDKAELLSYEKAFGHSFMPGYSAALNNQQIDDLVSYLMSLKGE